MLFFCQFLEMKTSLLAGSMTLVVMNFPTMMRTIQESLKTVPQSYREGAFGLGAGKWRVIKTVVIPQCIDGIVTGIILSVGKIIGESAALLFTAGFAHSLNGFIKGLTSSGSTLTVALYVYAKEHGEFGVAFAIAVILLILTFIINTVAEIIGESAALLFTAGFAHSLNGFIKGLTSSGSTLTVALYVYAKEQGEFGVAFAIAVILLILTFIINTVAEIIGKNLKKRK